MQPAEEKLVDTFDVAHKEGERFVRGRYGVIVLASISFVESALIVPVVTDPFLIGYVIANRKRALWYVAVTSVSSIVGGVFAYASAFWFYDAVVTPFITAEQSELLADTTNALRESVFPMTLVGAITPVPYTITAIAAGFVQGSIIAFLLASVVGRTARYALVGWLSYHYGERALLLVRRHILPATLVAVVLSILFVWYKFG